MVKVLVNLPDEIDFPVNVDQVRANATVYYHGRELGLLDLKKWQEANSTRVDPHGKESGGLLVESIIENAPLHVTNDGVFTDVVQSLLFGGKAVLLSIKADVDVKIKTGLGTFAVKQIPAEGIVPVKRPSSFLTDS